MTAPDRFNLQKRAYLAITQCEQCQFIFMNPRPTPAAIGQFYESSGYQPFLSTQSPQGLWDRTYEVVRRWAVGNKRRKIARLKSVSSLLDVGCGTGEFLQEMRTHGWQVHGVEKEAKAAQFARQKYDLAVHTGELSDCQFEAGSFHVITFWHVLEHLFDPLAVLRQCRHWLHEDGLILVAAPNISSLDARFYQENWVALDAPRHLIHITPGSMTRLCHKADLAMTGHEQMILDVFYNCLLSEKLLLDVQKRSAFVVLPAFARALLVACSSAIAASAAGRERLGSSVLYIIKKRAIG